MIILILTDKTIILYIEEAVPESSWGTEPVLKALKNMESEGRLKIFNKQEDVIKFLQNNP
jgi:hypothetical protein